MCDYGKEEYWDEKGPNKKSCGINLIKLRRTCLLLVRLSWCQLPFPAPLQQSFQWHLGSRCLPLAPARFLTNRSAIHSSPEKKIIKKPNHSLVKCSNQNKPIVFSLGLWVPSFNHLSSCSSCLQFCLIPSFLLSSLVFSWCTEICYCSRQAIISQSPLAGPSGPLHCCSRG